MQRGRRQRCYGYSSEDERWAYCTREEYGRGVPFATGAGAYAHLLDGDCRCGVRHGGYTSTNRNRPDPTEKDHRVSDGGRDGQDGQSRGGHHADNGHTPNDDRPKTEVATYDYFDEDGVPRYQVVRYRYDDNGEKTFRLRRPDGSDGWIWNLKDVTRLPYRLPELLIALLENPDVNVYIPEGERDVDRLWDMGLVATCNSEGAGSFQQELVPYFDRTRPVLLQDNDGDGERHVHKTGTILHPVTASLKILDFTSLPKGGDVSDWLDAGHTAEDLMEMAMKTPDWKPSEIEHPTSTLRFYSAAEIARKTPKDTRWISKPWLPEESITEVDGKIKVAGKTTWIMALCRKVLDGQPFMGEQTIRTPVVYLTEQPSASLREALRRADLLDREDFHILKYQDAIGTAWKEIVEAAVQKCRMVGAKLLVVDTLPQFAGLRGNAENDSGAALEALEPIQIAAAMGIGVIVSRHDGKAAREVGDSGRGSSAWGGVADIIVSIRRGEGNTSPTVRVLHCLSRFDATPDRLVIDLRDGEYVAVGTETQMALQYAKKAILEAAPTSEEEAKKAIDLIESAEGVKATVGKEAIKELYSAGKLRRIGRGSRGSAFKFWAPELIESYIGNGVPTESNIEEASSEDEEIQGRSIDLGERTEIHSVGTTILYATESINDDFKEV